MKTGACVVRNGFGSATAAISLLAFAGAARGQNALGDGRALDRNLNAAQGTYNPSGPRIEDQVRYNNALITGNVTGGKSFRGVINYRATTDFGGRLGSDDLYNFRRDSAISAVGGLGIRASDALRYQFLLSTGQSVPSYAAQGTSYADRSFASAPVDNSNPAGAITTGSLRSTSEYLTGQSIRPAFVGSKIDEQGYEFTARASPMMGINWVRSTNPVVRLDRPEDKTAADDLGAVSSNPLAAPTMGNEQPIDSKRTVPGASGAEPSTPGVQSPLDRESPSANIRLQPAQLQAASPVYARVYDAFKQGFGAPTTTSESAKTEQENAAEKVAKPPVDNSLDAQLARLRGELKTDSNPRPTSAWKAPRIDEADKPNANSNLGDLLSQNKDRKDSSAKPQSGNSDLAKLLRPDDMKSQDKPTPEENALKLSANERLTPELSRALHNTGSIRIDTLKRVEAMEQPMPPDKVKYQAAMSAGEVQFTQGKYFDAEDRFSRAMAAWPGEPMARIGRAHAQLGAGLFLSSAANLRNVFADHPELIGTKYADNLTLPAERAELISKQLREEMARGSSALGRDSAFLLAYLGHLRGDDKMMDDGLVEMSHRFDPKSDADATFYQACKAAWSK